MPFPASHKSRPAFTLLEVMIATMILGLLMVTLYRFLAAHLMAMHATSEWGDEHDATQAVVRLVRSQLNGLPPQGTDMLDGHANKFHGLSNDEITWRSSAGPGLLSATAAGEFHVTLTVQPVNEKSAETELGLRRQPIDPKRAQDVDLDRGGGDHKYNWLPLIRPMAALEIRYYDARLNSWLDAWTDSNRYPDLVRVRLWKRADDAPVEAVFTVPATNTQQ
jgi:prepilin-type N-terminal cleavage/methylation domain-containing protein